MKKHSALKTIMTLSILGMIFSGYLSYTELFTDVCLIGGCSNIGRIPVCVYGFTMYLVVFIVALFGIKSKE